MFDENLNMNETQTVQRSTEQNTQQAAEAAQQAAQSTQAQQATPQAAQATQQTAEAAQQVAQAQRTAEATQQAAQTTQQAAQTTQQAAQQTQQRAQQPYNGQYSWVNPRVQQARQERERYTYAEWLRSQQSRQAGQGAAGQTNYTTQTSAARDRRTSAARPKKKSGAGKWARLIAMALVFGLIAGGAGYGVMRAGVAIFGSGQKQVVQQAATYTKIGSTARTESGDEDGSASTETERNDAGAVAEVAANAMPSLVTISTMTVAQMQDFFGGTQQYEVEGAGTGVIVGQNETELLIATNDHVIEGATQVSVGFIDEEAVSATIKGTDSKNDLAVVAVKLADIPSETMDAIKVITIGNSDDLVLGEQVVAIGNALGYGQSVTSGYISGFDRELSLSDGTEYFVSSGLIQTDAAINSGNSGGALLNMRGELVGINEAKSSMTSSGATVDNVGYSIPIAKAEPILEKLMNLVTKEKVSEAEQGYLGIRCADVNQETSERYGMPVGVYVRQVVEGGPAAEGGLQVGDVITELDGREVSSYDDLVEALSYCRNGEEVTIVAHRASAGNYEEMSVQVKLGEQQVLDRLESDSGESRDSGNAPFGN